MRFNDRGIRIVLASVLLAVAFAVLIAAAPGARALNGVSVSAPTLAQPHAASASVVPSWSHLQSSLTAPAPGRASGTRLVITRLSLSAAKPGTRLTIRGRGFGARRGKGSVLFGAFKSTSYVRWSATRIICKVPVIPAAKLTLKVRTAKRTSNGKRFTVRPLPTVIPKTTDVLNAATVGGATTADGSTYSFANTSQTSKLAAGDVIVGKPTAALPEGIFRKVTAVTPGGSTVTTAPATLDEVFKSAQFSADHAITQSDFTGAAAAPGVRLMQSVVVRPDTRLLTFRLADVAVSKSKDLGADFGPVAVSGTITLKITVHVAGAVDLGGVKSFETSETTTVSSDLKASVTKELSFDQEKTLASWGAGQLTGFTVMVGPVPLYFQPELAIFVGVNGQFTAGAETAAHYEASGSLGVRYQAPKFSTWTQVSTKKSYTPPTLFASGSVKAYAGAQLGLKLYAAAGPYVRMDGYAKLAADTRETPWWTLKAGVEARMGAQIGVNWGFIHWNKDWKSGDLKLAEWTLAQASTPAPSPGTIAGLIEDTNGNALDSVDVAVSNGATTFASTVSSSDGTYAMDVPVGSDYTVTFSKDGYASDSRGGISVSEGETTTLDPVTLAALPSPGETRIVLTWGQDPADLDSHLVGPYADGSLFHVFFQQLGDSSYAELDYDCTTSFGPETIALYSQIDGTYSYAVHDYTNRDSTESSSLSQSGATVRVYRGDTLAAAFSVPADVSGTLWTVFTMDGNVITPVNTMSYESDPYAVLMPASAAILSTSSDSKQK